MTFCSRAQRRETTARSIVRASREMTPREREAAVVLKGKSCDSSVACELSEILRSEEDAGVREAAAEALGKCHNTCVEAEVASSQPMCGFQS